MPISKRQLTKWRKEALQEQERWNDSDSTIIITKSWIILNERILQMTQELLDQHMLKEAKI